MKLYTLPLLALLFTACSEKESLVSSSTHIANLDCNSLYNGFLTEDKSIIKPIIDSICQHYQPVITSSDNLGHQKNTDAIVKELNEKCAGLKIELMCYACLESLPVQSSFIVTIDSNNVQIERHFSLFVPEGKVMYMNN